MNEEKCVVVTPEQFARGYLRWRPGRVDQDGHVHPTHHAFRKIRDLADGNVLVEVPEWEPVR